MTFSQDMIALGPARWGVAVLIGAIGLFIAVWLFHTTMSEGILVRKTKPPQ